MTASELTVNHVISTQKINSLALGYYKTLVLKCFFSVYLNIVTQTRRPTNAPCKSDLSNSHVILVTSGMPDVQ